MFVLARDSAPESLSTKTTGCPCESATCAIPVPMAPAPSTPTICIGLFPGERRRPLLLEGAHAFFVIRGPRRQALQLALELELVFEAVRHGLVERALDEAQGPRRLARQVARERAGGLHQ